MVYLLDTNILTAILKKNEKISNKLEEVAFIGQEVFISCIAYYESKRGLLYANATRQLSNLIKGNRKLLTGNSVGNVRGFEERPKRTAYRCGGLQLPRIIERLKTCELLTVRNELLRVPR